MKTQLTHLYTQVTIKGADQSHLKITVDYDTVGKDWTLVKILAIDCKTKSAVDLTHIFFDCFHDEATAIVDSIDWAGKVGEEEKPKTVNWANVNPIFQQSLKSFIQ